jgi:hypothetical protein
MNKIKHKNGKQVYFYLTEKDERDLIAYVQKFDLLVLEESSPTQEAKVCDDIFSENETANLWRKFLVPKNLVNEVIMRYNEKRNLYFVEEIFSPVIEWHRSVLRPEKNTLSRGRFYFQSDFFDETGAIKAKNPELLISGNALLKFIKQHFKTSELAGGCYASEAALAFAQKGGDLKVF